MTCLRPRLERRCTFLLAQQQIGVPWVISSVQRETQNSREGFRLWQTLQQREVAYVWRLFQARLRREDEDVRASVARASKC